MQKTFLSFAVFMAMVAAIVITVQACAHKPVDPGTLKDQASGLYSLPAALTSGVIKFKAQMYKTDGVQEIKSYNTTGYNGVELTYNLVGAEIQFYKVKRPNGTYTYRPRWVISGGRTQDDVNNKRNIIVITILPAFDNSGQLASDTDTTPALECSRSSNILAANFCENNFQGTGLFKASNSALNFYSFESNTYPQCPSSDGTMPFDASNTIDPDTASPGDCNKEFYYKFDGGNTGIKKFNVVIEFIDVNGNVYTTKFPYNKDLDNLGNHTPVLLELNNMPNPYLDPANFTGATPVIDKYIYTDSGTSNSNSSANCTGIQGFDTDPGAGVVLGYDCNSLITKIDQTVNNNNLTNGRMDDDIIHKMQQAGKEFRAKGTDSDPRFELMITDIYFKVERGANNFIESDE